GQNAAGPDVRQRTHGSNVSRSGENSAVQNADVASELSGDSAGAKGKPAILHRRGSSETRAVTSYGEGSCPGVNDVACTRIYTVRNDGIRTIIYECAVVSDSSTDEPSRAPIAKLECA